MTEFLVAKQELVIGGYRFSPQMKTAAAPFGRERLDKTTWGQTTRVFKQGLRKFAFTGQGLWEPTTDGGAIESQELDSVPFSLAIRDGLVGSPAMFGDATFADWSVKGNVGELIACDIELGASDTVYRGTILHNGSATGNVTGTVLELGAVDDDPLQYLRAVLHVASGTGALIVKVQSDSAEAFSTPTDRITFSTILTGNPRGYQLATAVAGPITDTWWRIVATNPNTRDFAVVMGIR